MASVRLGANGEVEIIDPGTPEERVEAEAAVLKIAALLGEIAAHQEWRRQEAERRTKRDADVASAESDDGGNVPPRR